MTKKNYNVSSSMATPPCIRQNTIFNCDDDKTSSKIQKAPENRETAHTKTSGPTKGPPWYRSQRYILAYILFGGVMNAFFQRNNISIAIVCMVNHTATDTSSDSESLTRHSTNVSIKVLGRRMISNQLEELKFKQHGNLSWLNFTNDAMFEFSNELKKLVLDTNKSFDLNDTNIDLILNTSDVQDIYKYFYKSANPQLSSLQASQKLLHSIMYHNGANNSMCLQRNNTKCASYKELLSLNETTPFNRVERITFSKNSSTSRENKSSDISSNSGDLDSCSSISKDKGKEDGDGPLIWDKETQGIVLGAIYWTYSALSFPGNILVRKISKKRVIAVSMTVMSLLTLVTHVTALWSPWAVVVIRLVQGACTALSMMTMYGIWVSWAQPEERSGLLSLSFSGAMSANAIVFPASGFLCKYGFLGGWPSVFYVFGSVGLLWVIVFILFTAETPAQHQTITAEERNYIEASLPDVTHTQTAPWKSVLTSRPVWAIILQHLCYSWGLFLIMTTGPQYMREVLKFPIDSNGLYIMLPYLFQYVLASLSGQIITVLLKKNLVPLIWIRKMGSVIGNVIPAILLLILSYLDCTQSALAVSLLTLTVGLSGINLNTFFVNPYDIAPQFSQSIMTLSNSIAAANGAIAPYVVAAMTKHRSKSEWQNVFFITSAILVFGTVIYCIMGSVYRQKWAEPRLGETSDNREITIYVTDLNKVYDNEVITTKDEKDTNFMDKDSY